LAKGWRAAIETIEEQFEALEAGRITQLSRNNPKTNGFTAAGDRDVSLRPRTDSRMARGGGRYIPPNNASASSEYAK
jgi:hypothetical protein